MKKLILSSIMAVALMASMPLMAQEAKKAECTKAKTECTKTDKKECTDAKKKDCTKKEEAKPACCSKKTETKK